MKMYKLTYVLIVILWFLSYLLVMGCAYTPSQETKDSNYYYALGKKNYDQGNYNQALTELNKAIELNPNLAKAYENRGKILIKKGNPEDACSDFLKACDLGACNRLNQAHNEKNCR